MASPPEIEGALERLKALLGENLYSCILYGSTVRGDALSRVSDFNLLIILEESTPEAHAAIAEVVQSSARISPFVLGRAGLDRSFRAFALKFVSIRRHYRVLHGADPLATLHVDPELLRFLCEQAVRNTRLRLVHAFIVSGHDGKRYAAQVLGRLSGIFIDLSAALRLEGIAVPERLPERIGVFEATFEADGSVLRDLLALKARRRALSPTEAASAHARLYGLLTQAVRWIEARWPLPAAPKTP